MKKYFVLSAAAVAMIVGTTLAAPQETQTTAGPISLVAFAPQTVTATFTGLSGGTPYVAAGFEVRFDLAEVAAGTYANDVLVSVTPPPASGIAAFELYRPDGLGYTTVLDQGGAFALPLGMTPAQAIGTWTFTFVDDYDDADFNGAPGTPEADLTNVRISLQTAEPFTAALSGTFGPLGAEGASENVVTQTVTTSVASEVNWFKITTTVDALEVGTSYLDIDTEGTAAGATEGIGGLMDTYIGLFSSSSAPIAEDDDSGTGYRSMLTFGATASPRAAQIGVAPAGNGTVRDGLNGDLPAGTYYLAVSTFLPTFEFGWVAVGPTNRTAVGERVVNVRTNMATTSCTCCNLSNVAGPNQSTTPDGSLTADDIIVFLGWFFANDARANVAGANQSTIPDNALTADDIIVFLGRYFAGC